MMRVFIFVVESIGTVRILKGNSIWKNNIVLALLISKIQKIKKNKM